MMLPRETLELIQATARDACRIQHVDIEKLRKVAVIVPGSGDEGDNIAVHDYPPALRGGELHALNDVIAAAKDAKVCPDPEVYHDTKKVQILIDRSNRRESIRMPLHLSEHAQLVTNMRIEDGLTSAQLIQLIRFKLPNVKGAAALVAALRKVDFKRRSDGTRTTEHGRESLGRTIEAEVQGAADIPEEFSATFPYYSDPGLVNVTEVTVRIGVHIDVENERIHVAPLADELVKAHDKAHAVIGNELRAGLESIPVFYGCPA